MTDLLRPAAVFGGALALGLFGAGAMMGDGMVNAQVGDRGVTVRGVSEREVKSDLAALPLSVDVIGPDLAEAQARADRDLETLRAFLTRQGYTPEQVQLGRYVTSDRWVGVEEKDRPPERWSVTQYLTVRTTDVDRLERTARELNGLVRQGNLFINYSQPSFYFTKLNALRPSMIGEATASARLGAQEFAKDSRSRIGGIKQASQGYFEVEGRDPDAGEESAQMFKRVRVVTTVTYQLR